MRIKWNRHLDGSSTRQPEEGSATQADEKKSSAAPGIFRIFRRKKKSRRGEDDCKPGSNNNTSQADFQQEADDADRASISSIATCASQPVTDGFQRDRASSLFSSFRLSLPGSKRKKRKIAPAPSDTVLNGQQSQTERYSTPDLRKPSDKLGVANDTDVCHSTSSPSIRNPKGSLTIAQSLGIKNPDTTCKLKLNGTSSPNSKLRKSVSFSSCKVTSIDISHSTDENPLPETEKCFIMVEENSKKAVESELPSCFSDNLRESKLTSFGDPSSIPANVSGSQKQPGDAAGNTVDMTKTEIHHKESDISDIDNILSNIVCEIRNYSKDANGIQNKGISVQGSHFGSLNVHSMNGGDNEVDAVRRTDYERCAVRVNLGSSDVTHVETGSTISPETKWNTFCGGEANGECEIVLQKEDNETTIHQNDFNLCDIKVPFKNLHSSSTAKLDSVVNSKDLSTVTSFETDSNYEQDVVKIEVVENGGCLSKTECTGSSFVQNQNDVKQAIIAKDKHVVCHLRVFQNSNEKLQNISDATDSISAIPIPLENVSARNLCANFSEKIDALGNDFVNLSSVCDETPNSDIQHNSICCASNKFDLADSGSNISNLINQNENEFDQKVPLGQFISPKYSSMKEQVVPEFELSLLEFEEMCNKYTSPKDVTFSDSISNFIESPKRKSVLNLHNPSVYSNYHDSQDSELNNVKGMKNALSERFDYIRQGFDMCSHPLDACLSPTMFRLPLLPKQWINYDNPMQNDCSRDVCTDRVQCTKVRGKNLCQKSCPGGFPSTVMHEDSDLGGFDTPQLSPTLEKHEDKSGRGIISFDTAGEQYLVDDHAPLEDIVSKEASIKVSSLNAGLNSVSENSGKDTVYIIDADEKHPSACGGLVTSKDMVSKVCMTISDLNTVSDCSYFSETPGGDTLNFDSEIREPYRFQRGICDPLVYPAERTKGLESRSKSYLSDHNFTDIRNIGLCEVITDVSCDYAQGGQGLIEIANPYQDDSFIVPHRTSNHNFMNGISVSTHSSNNADNKIDACVNDPKSDLKCDITALQDSVAKTPEVDTHEDIISETHNDISLPDEEKITSIARPQDIPDSLGNNKSNYPTSGKNKRSSVNRLSNTEKNNLINKTKSSIPCRMKIPRDIELKRIEVRSKSKKANTIPRLNKNESVSLKSNSTLRHFTDSYKDSDEGINCEQKNYSILKCNGNHLEFSPATFLNAESNHKVNSESTFYQGSELPGGQNKSCTTNSSKLSELSDYFDETSNFDNKSDSSSIIIDLPHSEKEKLSDSGISALLTTRNSQDNLNTTFVLASNCIKSDSIVVNSESDAKVVEIRSVCPPSIPNGEECVNTSSECFENANGQSYQKSLDIMVRPRGFSLPAVGLVKKSFTSSKESINSQLTNSSTAGKSRIPKKQSGSRGPQPSSKGPVRPPMWLSKAELTQEIQRLGTLCESRTKELNRLKMETKHVSVGFDAFASLFKYMVEDLNALSIPTLTEDLEKTLKQLEVTKQDLAFYEKEVEEIKSHHCQELNDLSNKLFEVYQSEVAELNAKHLEEVNHMKNDHEKQIEHLTSTFDASSAETKSHHEKLIASLEQEIIKQREELQLFQEKEIKDLEEKHAESTKLLHDHIEQLQKKSAELKQHSMSMEDAMRKDTDSKLQWVSTVKLDLEKEVESLKAVLEMKNKELHTLRIQNLEMEKQLEELPFAREKIKMLQARAEDLEALMIEKTKVERKLSTENQQIKDTYEKENKVNRRLSMENEELQWRLRQAENSLISGSFQEVPEVTESEEATSPTKSPGPHIMSRSVFFTYVDKDESSPHSPRSQYKKITPSFSASYKTSPAKSSKSPPNPSPRRLKSHSEPPQPAVATSTPRKNVKLPFSKSKGPYKRQRSETEVEKEVGDATGVAFSSVTGSMASSVSSESSLFEHKERFLDEHKEQIIHSLEILREQRSAEMNTDEPTMMEKKWSSDDIKITGQIPNLETEDMSRSAEFADPKSYYHMTFAVLKEPSDNDDGKNSSSGNSSVKELMSPVKHSKSADNISKCAVTEEHTLKIMSASVQEMGPVTDTFDNERSNSSELIMPSENAQNENNCNNTNENCWRTI